MGVLCPKGKQGSKCPFHRDLLSRLSHTFHTFPPHLFTLYSLAQCAPMCYAGALPIPISLSGCESHLPLPLIHFFKKSFAIASPFLPLVFPPPHLCPPTLLNNPCIYIYIYISLTWRQAKGSPFSKSLPPPWLVMVGTLRRIPIEVGRGG